MRNIYTEVPYESGMLPGEILKFCVNRVAMVIP